MNIRSHPAIAKALQVDSTSGPWDRQSITHCLVLSPAVLVLVIDRDEYLELLDATGRILRPGKSGSIPSHLAGILDRLGIRSEMWSTVNDGYEQLFGKIVGRPSQVIHRAEQAGRHWCWGIPTCAATFT